MAENVARRFPAGQGETGHFVFPQRRRERLFLKGNPDGLGPFRLAGQAVHRLGRFAADDEPTAASGKFAQHALGRAAHGVQAAHQNRVIAGLAHAQALALRRGVLGHQAFIAIIEIDVAALQ